MPRTEVIRNLILEAAADREMAKSRKDLALYASAIFSEVGDRLYGIGYVYGPDRVAGLSPFGFGTDELVGMSVLLRIGGQLISAGADLLTEGRPYAGAALLRQIVEIEYLAWAFEGRHRDAERWLRSDRKIREEFFRPAKLRQAAGNKFRGKDYSFQCELGGHPVPAGTALLRDNDQSTIQLLMSDMLGRTGGIWNHFIGWAKNHEDFTAQFKNHAFEMAKRFKLWHSSDPLVDLPPP